MDAKKTSTAASVEAIESLPLEEALLAFKALKAEESVEVFEYLSFPLQKEVLQSLPSDSVAHLLNKISPDDRTALLEQFSPELVSQLLKYLTPEERTLSIKLLGYPENSVGRLMTPDYIAVKMEWTVKEVLDVIREKGKDSETINVIYAVDDQGVLLDDFRIRQFLLAKVDTKVSEIADRHFVALQVNDSEQKAINTFKKYGRFALPVIDTKGVLLGIVTSDDIISLSIEKDTEAFQLLGGANALKDAYLRVPFFQLIRKRVGWLTILFLGEMLTASAMGFFQDEIAKAVVLALFLPLIISSGGNAGNQASTLVIRALALGEIKLKDWWQVMHREILSGVFLGVILGAIGFFRITFWSFFSTIYGAHWLLLALTIFTSITGVVLWGTFTGAMLPFLLKKCGFDPAVSSAPFVATLVDVTGLIIYFSIALLLLNGTLL